MNAETEKQLQQLQLIEQQVQHLASQRQQLQLQLSEINSAQEELKDKKQGYKIIGALMILNKAEDLNKSLETQSNTLKLRIEKLEQQETQLAEKAQKTQKEVLKEMKNG